VVGQDVVERDLERQRVELGLLARPGLRLLLGRRALEHLRLEVTPG
jgi:hypothetical protein